MSPGSCLVLIIYLLNLATILAQNLEKSRNVWIEQGLVRGKIYKLQDQQIQIFRGIPYAGLFISLLSIITIFKTNV